jgi:hypothetical protein
MVNLIMISERMNCEPEVRAWDAKKILVDLALESSTDDAGAEQKEEAVCCLM